MAGNPNLTFGGFGLPVDAPNSLVRTKQNENEAARLRSDVDRMKPDVIDLSAQLGGVYGGSWVDYGGGWEGVKVFRVNGVVHLSGLVGGGTAGSTLFTLDYGFRPTGNVLFAVLTNTGVGRIDINTAGAVSHQSGGNAYLSLSGISFLAA